MPEITPSYIRIPIHRKTKEDTEFVIFTISDKLGIKALYSVNRKKIITLLFSRDKKYKWSVKKAKEWISDHKSTLSIATNSNIEDLYLNAPENYEEIVTFIIE